MKKSFLGTLIVFVSAFSLHAAPPPPTPTLFTLPRDPVTGYGFTLDWTKSTGATLYEVQRAVGSNFNPPAQTYWPTSDLLVLGPQPAGTYQFRVRAWKKPPQNGGVSSGWSNVIQVVVLDDTAFLDLVARKTFDYFLASTYPTTGLTRDRLAVDGSGTPPASIAAGGFYLSALTVGAERGWISFNDAQTRALTALETYRSGTPTVHGFYYHFLNPDGTPSNVPFLEVSSIDTALLMAGALQAGEYFGGEVQTIANEIYERVEWDWMLDPATKLFRQAWTETGGYVGYYNSFSEGNLLYLLAIGSPTHPTPADSFYSFARPKGSYTGPNFVFTGGGQIFTYQYPQAWFDFRNTTDYLGVNWWQNSIEGVRANQRWCADNPGLGYSQHLWGLTACDGPNGYKAYGAKPSYWQEQDGTIAPTGIGGSVPIAPDLAIPSLKHLYTTYGNSIWKTYGFVDSFHPGLNWVDGYYLGIDQGIILLMLENHRSGMVWETFMQNPHVLNALARAGFSGYASSAPDVSLENFEDQNFWTPDTSFGWWETDRTAVYQRSNEFGTVSEGAVSLRLQYAKNGLPWSITSGHISAANPNHDFSNHELLTMKVFGACEILVKLRDGTFAEQEVGTLRAVNPNGWNTLTFDISSLGLNTESIENVMFFVDPANPSSSGTVLFDDIRLESRNSAPVENFEDGNLWTPDSTLGWWDIDGTTVYQRSISLDPSLGGFGAMRVNYNKNGLPWSYFGGYLSPSNPRRDFTGHTRVVVWVYGQANVLLKLRDRSLAEADVSTEQATNSNGWTRLEFDYSDISSIVNLSDIENLLFFVEPGNGTASGTIWIDDIVLE